MLLPELSRKVALFAGKNCSSSDQQTWKFAGFFFSGHAVFFTGESLTTRIRQSSDPRIFCDLNNYLTSNQKKENRRKTDKVSHG